MAAEDSIRQQLEDSLLLYLPTNLSLSDTGKLEYEFERVSNINYQVESLLIDEIDSEYFLDFIESQDIDMDDYLSIACDNLEKNLQI